MQRLRHVHRNDRVSGRARRACSVVTDAWYADEEHYSARPHFGEIDGIVERIEKWRRPDDLDAARRQIVRKLVAASTPGDYFTWKNFDRNDAGMRDSGGTRWSHRSIGICRDSEVIAIRQRQSSIR